MTPTPVRLRAKPPADRPAALRIATPGGDDLTTDPSAAHGARLPDESDETVTIPLRRRATWRQRLVEAEGGLRLALRSNSTLFVHLFAGSVMLVTGAVVGFSVPDWLFILAAFAAVIAAETFNLAIQTLAAELASNSPAAWRRTFRLSTAATLTVVAGAVLTSLVIIARHLGRLFG